MSLSLPSRSRRFSLMRAASLGGSHFRRTDLPPKWRDRAHREGRSRGHGGYERESDRFSGRTYCLEKYRQYSLL
jgi:hypothetical protein